MNGTLADRLLSKMAGKAPNFPWRSVAGKSSSDVRHPSVLSWFSTAEDKSFPAAGIGSGIGDSSFLNYSDLNPKSHTQLSMFCVSCFHPYTRKFSSFMFNSIYFPLWKEKSSFKYVQTFNLEENTQVSIPFNKYSLLVLNPNPKPKPIEKSPFFRVRGNTSINPPA